MKKFHVIYLGLLLGLGLILLQFFAAISGWTSNDSTSTGHTAPARLSEAITLHVAGQGKPWINLQDGRELLTAYAGIDETQIEELRGARPLAQPPFATIRHNWRRI